MSYLAHDRAQHEASCPCKLCIGYDIHVAVQDGLAVDHYKPGGLESLILLYRQRKLNWDLPSGHCLLCGGTSMSTHKIGEHHIIKRFNQKDHNNLHLCSLLVHKQGALSGVIKLLSHDHLKLRKWASHLQDLLPEKCIGLTTRDIGDWYEVRLAYSELVEDPIDRRIERRWRESDRPRKESHSHSST